MWFSPSGITRSLKFDVLTTRSGEFSKSGWTWTGIWRNGWDPQVVCETKFHEQRSRNVISTRTPKSNLDAELKNIIINTSYITKCGVAPVDWNRFRSLQQSQQPFAPQKVPGIARSAAALHLEGNQPHENRGEKWLDLQCIIWFHLRIIW